MCGEGKDDCSTADWLRRPSAIREYFPADKMSAQTVPDVPGMVEESPASVSFKPPPRDVRKVEGDIDIEKYDLPQADANLEWWYFNAHVKSKGGRHFSMFASFFRRPLDVTSEDPARDFCDTCTWALVDVEGQQYIPDSLLDYRSCEVIAQKLDPEISGKPCQHAEGPLLKMVKQKRLPRPDRLMKGAARVAKDKLSLDLDTECTLKKRPVTSDEAKMQTSHAPAVAYEVKNKNSAKNCSSELTFLPQQSVVLHGADGMVNNMFYYYIPRCSVKGSIFLDGEEHEAGAHSRSCILVIPLARRLGLVRATYASIISIDILAYGSTQDTHI